MDEAFRRYLLTATRQGSNRPLAASTQKNYLRMVNSILQREGYGWTAGAQNIDYLMHKYSADGEMNEFNESRHNAPHAALVAFKCFLSKQ